MTQRTPIPQSRVIDQLHALGVMPGGVLLVHTAFRTTGPVEGGPAGLIAALREALGSEGTLAMPSWPGDDDTPFDPRTAPTADDLGVVAQTFWRQPGVLRSGHSHAFAAAGPLAARIVGDPLALPPCVAASPVGRVHEADGQVLLLGVGHDGNTTLHMAELMAGAPYRIARHVTVLQDGRPVRMDYGENDCCCVRFALADDWLRGAGLQQEDTVGHGHARLMRSQDLVRLAVEQLRRDPLLFLHSKAEGCAECDLARAGIAR